MDGVAPFFCTAKAEAAVAHFKAKAWFMPLARLVIKYPKKVSPAAVVSTASTLNKAKARGLTPCQKCAQ